MTLKYFLLAVLFAAMCLSSAAFGASPARRTNAPAITSSSQATVTNAPETSMAVPTLQSLESELKVVEARADDFHSMLEIQTTIFSVIVAIALAALGFLTYINLRAEFKLQLNAANESLVGEQKKLEMDLLKKLSEESKLLESRFRLQNAIVYRALAYGTRDLPAVAFIWALRAAEERHISGLTESDGVTIEAFISRRLEEALMFLEDVTTYDSADRGEEALQIIAKLGQYEGCEKFIKDLYVEIARVIALRPKEPPKSG